MRNVQKGDDTYKGPSFELEDYEVAYLKHRMQEHWHDGQPSKEDIERFIEWAERVRAEATLLWNLVSGEMIPTGRGASGEGVNVTWADRCDQTDAKSWSWDYYAQGEEQGEMELLSA